MIPGPTPADAQNQLNAFGTTYYDPQWAPGNETDIGAPYLYPFAHQPWKTQAELRAAQQAYKPIALGLPEAYEERAWVGTRWRVRGRTFAHALEIVAGRPQSHARAAGTAGPRWILTFRSSGLELETLRRTGPPFFAAPWRGDEVGMFLAGDVDPVGRVMADLGPAD